jgi:hypothetical protein
MGTPTALPVTELRGRGHECGSLDRLLDDVHSGRSRVLVLRGEAGVGKSALLDYLVAKAPGCRVARAVGVESEMELAFAGVHQLCAPLLSHRERLPSPQRHALETAFGLSTGAPTDRFLVGLAVLSLLSEAAEARPLICVVDDAQWLDQASAQVLGFVARRLLAESVALVFAVRDTREDNELGNVPVMVIEGLSDADARALLNSAIPGKLDEGVRDRVIAESNGNPLALLELPKGLSAAELAGGFRSPDVRPVSSRIEQSFLRRVRSLPVESRRLLLAAAAEPVGDVILLRRASETLGIGTDAAAPAVTDGLVDIGARVRFRHPLARSAAYRAATTGERVRAFCGSGAESRWHRGCGSVSRTSDRPHARPRASRCPRARRGAGEIRGRRGACSVRAPRHRRDRAAG